MSRFVTPIVVLASIVVIAGCGASTGSAAPVAGPLAGGPTFVLSLAATDPSQVIEDTGPFVADAKATMRRCSELEDGFWKMSYSGGDPYVRLDLLVGPDAMAGGPSEAVSGEIVIGSPLTTLVNFDQPGYRTGDARGRSEAVVEARRSGDAITFDVTATTPRAKVDFTDHPYTVDVDLTVTCPIDGSA